jgi:hypothetical protein
MFRKNSPAISPNQSSAPSEPTNNPGIWPYLSLDTGEQLFISDVPQDTAIGSRVGDTEYLAQGPQTMLAALRLQFPNLEVIPFPSRVKSVLLATAGLAQDITLPDGTVAIIMRGNNDYYVSNNGNAEIPFAVVNEGVYSQSVFKPEGYVLYVGNMRALSLIAPNANTIVTIMCYPLTPMNPG